MKLPISICCICQDDIITNCKNADQLPTSLQCGHIYHINCLKLWLKQKSACAHCRKPVPKKFISEIKPLVFDIPARFGDPNRNQSSDNLETAASSQGQHLLQTTQSFSNLQIEVENLNNELNEARQELDNVKVAAKKEIEKNFTDRIEKLKEGNKVLIKKIKNFQDANLLSKNQIMQRDEEISTLQQKVKVYKQKLDVVSVIKILGNDTSSAKSKDENNLIGARAKYLNLDKESLIDCLCHLQMSINSERKAHENKISGLEGYRDKAVKFENNLRLAKNDNQVLNKELEKYMNLCEKLKRENKGLSSVGSVLLEPSVTSDSIKNSSIPTSKKRKLNVISDSSQDEEENDNFNNLPQAFQNVSPITTPKRVTHISSKNSDPKRLSGVALFASQVQDSSTPLAAKKSATLSKSPVKTTSNRNNKLLNLQKPEKQGVNYHTSKNNFPISSGLATSKFNKKFTFKSANNNKSNKIFPTRSRSEFDLKPRPSIHQNRNNRPLLEKITDERQILAELPKVNSNFTSASRNPFMKGSGAKKVGTKKNNDENLVGDPSLIIID